MVANVLSTQKGGNGFFAGVTGAEARRQLRMSVGIVVVLAVGIVSAAVTVGPHTLAAKRDIVSAAPLSTVHAASNAVGARAI